MLCRRPGLSLLHLTAFVRSGSTLQKNETVTERNMTATAKPEIGATAIANGIQTNYLEDGSGDETVLLIHGSGPGVTSYANWRLVIPALATKFRVIAPDMVGFGFSERPKNIDYSLQTWADQVVGLMDTLGIEKTSLVGNSFGGAIALRIATQHPGPCRQAGLDGQHGGALPDHRGPRARVGVRSLLREHAQGARRVRLFARTGERRARPGALRRQHSAGVPGIVLVDVSGAAPAMGRGDVHPGRGHSTTSTPNTHHSWSRGPGDTGPDVASVGWSSSTTPICPSIHTAGTGR